jgi:hypothetical protein
VEEDLLADLPLESHTDDDSPEMDPLRKTGRIEKRRPGDSVREEDAPALKESRKEDFQGRKKLTETQKGQVTPFVGTDGPLLEEAAAGLPKRIKRTPKRGPAVLTSSSAEGGAGRSKRTRRGKEY